MRAITAQNFIEAITDDASFESWDAPPPPVPTDSAYAAQLQRAEERSGQAESILTGRATIAGRPVAIIAGEFTFLAGTIGRVSSDRIVHAFERAAAERLPLVASPISGGTRMQEGTHAFLQLVKISHAVHSYRAAGLPYLVYVRHPMTGGPVVSWGFLGQVTFAQPQALIGMLGPRVVEVLTGSPLPEEVQTSENLARVGLIDDVVALPDLRTRLTEVLEILDTPRVSPVPATPAYQPPERPAAQALDAVADPARLRLRDLISGHTRRYVPLLGTASPSYTGSVRVGLAQFATFSCMLLGHDGGEDADVLTPAGLEAIQRAVSIAAELGLPIVTIIDTPGVDVSAASEEYGIARGIARTTEAIATTDVPVVSVVLGAGTGVSALTLLPADRLICAEHAYITPLPPQAASEILYRTTERAGELAQAQGIGAGDLLATGLIDRVVSEESPGSDGLGFAARLVRTIGAALAEISDLEPASRLAQRVTKYREVF